LAEVDAEADEFDSIRGLLIPRLFLG
jgi:hypothetical protein